MSVIFRHRPTETVLSLKHVRSILCGSKGIEIMFGDGSYGLYSPDEYSVEILGDENDD